MNLEKRTNVKFVPSSKVSKNLKTNKLMRAHPVAPDSNVYEIVTKRSVTDDKIPVQEKPYIMIN